MRLFEPIVTHRLLLRTLAEDEVEDAYVRWMQDDEATRFLEVRHHPRDARALAAFIARMNESPDSLLLGIFLNPGERHIGNIKLGPIHPIHGRAAIGIMIGEKKEWGRGYAAEAIEAVSAHAFASLGLHRVEAGFYASNRSSMNAFAKAGFKVEGRLAGYWQLGDRRDDHIWMGRVRLQ